MLVKNFSKDSFIKLKKYAIDRSNYISFFIQYNRCHECSASIIQTILEIEKNDENSFFKTYTIDDISNLSEKYKNIYKIKKIVEMYLKNYIKNDICIEKVTESYIYIALTDAFYKYYSKENLKNYMSELVYEEKQFYGQNNYLFGITYYFKNTGKVKKDILESDKILWEWIFPYCQENICFLRNNQYWLKSVAHEKICNIYCESEEEYEYLKSIGIEFYEDKYVPISEIERKELMVAGLD